MSRLEAMMRLLAQHQPAQVKNLLRQGGHPMRQLLLDQLEVQGPEAAPDSQEASEQATISETTARMAGYVWRQLTPSHQAAVLQIYRQVGGNPEDLKEEMYLSAPA